MSTTNAPKRGLFVIYASHEDGVSKDGSVLERSHGCNGTRHVDQIDQVWRDANGEVSFAAQLASQEKGACDGTCGNLGFFVHP